MLGFVSRREDLGMGGGPGGLSRYRTGPKGSGLQVFCWVPLNYCEYFDFRTVKGNLGFGYIENLHVKIAQRGP